MNSQRLTYLQPLVIWLMFVVSKCEYVIRLCIKGIKRKRLSCLKLFWNSQHWFEILCFPKRFFFLKYQQMLYLHSTYNICKCCSRCIASFLFQLDSILEISIAIHFKYTNKIQQCLPDAYLFFYENKVIVVIHCFR